MRNMQRNRLFLPEGAQNALLIDIYFYAQDMYVPVKSIAYLKMEEQWVVWKKLSLRFFFFFFLQGRRQREVDYLLCEMQI